MKAISVKQPLASLICLGIKDIENRTWKCPQKYIGERVLIHASGNKNDIRFIDVLTTMQLKYVTKHWNDNLFTMKNGAIIGSVEITACIINHPSVWAEKSIENKCPDCGREITDLKSDYQWCPDCGRKLWRHSNYDKPTYNWVLANPVIFDTPIPAKGKLSFWESDVEICHICGKPTTKENLCERCEQYYCEDHTAHYDQFSQIDYNCCSKCFNGIRENLYWLDK